MELKTHMFGSILVDSMGSIWYFDWTGFPCICRPARDHIVATGWLHICRNEVLVSCEVGCHEC